MTITHSVSINGLSPSDMKIAILESSICTLPKRLVRVLFGGATQILGLKPSQTIVSGEVHEAKEDSQTLYRYNDSG